METGLSSDTETEITSGLSEGDTVVTNIVSSTSTQQSNGQTQSAFGNTRIGGFGR